MSDWGCFWIGFGFAVGMWFLGYGLHSFGQSVADAVENVIDFWTELGGKDDEE